MEVKNREDSCFCHGCSTVVEHMTCNQGFVGLKPARCWAFFFCFFLFFLSLSSFLYQWSVLNQVPQGGGSLTVCFDRNRKNGCLAVPNKLSLG